MQYNKWEDREIHVDDNSTTKYTVGTIIGYRLVRLFNNVQLMTDKQGKNGTTVRGIIKNVKYAGQMFYIKEGKVTSNDEVTGEYELIGIGKIMRTNGLIMGRNAERGQDQIDKNEVYSTTIKLDTQHNYSNCTVTPATGQVVDSGGANIVKFNADSTSVFHAGARMILGVDYTETPLSGKITASTFTIDGTTIVDCDRLIAATIPTAPIYEKIP